MDQQISEVLRIGTPSISTLNTGTGSRENGLLVFRTIILSVLEYYGTEWSEIQYLETADMMHREYHWLQIAEIKHFVLNAKAGTYNVKKSISRKTATGYLTEEYDGKIYGKLAPVTLMKWLSEYANESLSARAGIEDTLKNPGLLIEGLNKGEETSGAILLSEAIEGVQEAYKKERKALEESISARMNQRQFDYREQKHLQKKRNEQLVQDYATRHHINLDQVADHIKKYKQNDGKPVSVVTDDDIKQFAEGIYDGSAMGSPDEVEFYANNSVLIELALQDIKEFRS